MKSDQVKQDAELKRELSEREARMEGKQDKMFAKIRNSQLGIKTKFIGRVEKLEADLYGYCNECPMMDSRNKSI